MPVGSTVMFWNAGAARSVAGTPWKWFKCAAFARFGIVQLYEPLVGGASAMGDTPKRYSTRGLEALAHCRSTCKLPLVSSAAQTPPTPSV